jgi:hypothetical protein
MSGHPDRRGLHIAVLAAWIPPAALSLYVKVILLTQVGTCVNCLRLGGQSPGDKVGEIAFFRQDLLMALLIVPAGLLLVARLLHPRTGLAVAAGLSTLTFAWLFAQLKTLQSIGMFVSPGLLRDAIAWGWENPGRTAAYLDAGDAALLAGGLCWIAAASWGARRLREGPVPPADVRWRTGRRVALAATLAAPLILPWLPDVPVTPYHRSVLSWAFFSSRIGGALPRYDFSGATASDLVSSYRALSAAPVPSRDVRYWGMMADADVLLFVLETGTAESLAVAGDLSDFPSLRRLRERAFVAPAHYSTAPLTNHTWLSIFSSWYPSPANFDAAFDGRRILPGLVSRAAEAGYDTALFSRADPDRLVPGDTARLQALGFRRVEYPTRPVPMPDFDGEIARERQALDLLKADLAAWAGSGRRFVATFFPIIGHAPWPDPMDGRAHTLAERGRALMALQDRWLGELMDLLERHGRLDRTIIVVTADHGLRTRKEYPPFPLGMIDDITFHVPLLVYAPQALTSTIEVPWITSHIDIAPTVLDLLGLERNQDLEQGAAVWNPRLERRVTFQPASLYLGSDGLARDGRFLMYSYLTDRVFEAPQMRFLSGDERPRHSSEAADAIDLLQRFRALQAEWIAAMPVRR